MADQRLPELNVGTPIGTTLFYVRPVGETRDQKATLTAILAGGGALLNVVEDTSPQLGANLDTNGFNLVNNDGTLTGLSITAGTDAVDGGDLNLTAGVSATVASADGGDVNIAGGASDSTDFAQAGSVSVKGGSGTGAGNSTGGDLLYEVGIGGPTGGSGNFFVNTLTGAGAAAGLQVAAAPGLVALYGIGRSGGGPAGNLELWGGYASGNSSGDTGGDAILWGGGQGGGPGDGGCAMIIGGESDELPGDAMVIGGTATVNGPGGQAQITGGAGFGTNQDGGDVVITPGAATGAGTDGIIRVANATGPAILNEASGTLNPTLIPNRSDLDTGIGGFGTDQLSLIAGGVEAIRITEAASAIASIVPFGPIHAQDGTAGAPSYSFNSDLDTGITRTVADQLSLIAGGVEGIRVTEAAAVITNTLFGTTVMNIAGGPALQSEAATFNNPNILPNKTDDDTGIGYGGADILDLIAGASNRVRLTGGDSVFRGDWNANSASGPALLDETASTTNPTLVPNRADDDTGLGSAAADQLSLIAGGVEIARAQEAANDQFLVISGSATAPGISFISDPDSGLVSVVNDLVAMSIGGTDRFRWAGDQYRSTVSSGPTIQNEAASATNPTFCPNQTDTDTGLGHTGTDQLALVAGALDCMTVRETAGARQVGFYVTAPVSLQTGVGVDATSIHAALVNLGLITA